MESKKLFSQYELGNLKLKNRVVMAPMTRSRAINNIPFDIHAKYYGQRSGAGLIITEGTSPSPNGLGYPRIPGIFSKEQIEAWKLVTDEVHKKGGRIFIQLMHTGRVGHPDNLPQGAKVISPSELLLSGEMYTDSQGNQPYPKPNIMTVEDIQSTIREYIQAAENSVEAGFDGVEIHGANGYLVEQFLNANVNNRDDAYGGDYKKRSRFLIEITQGMVDAIGKEKVGLRVSPYGVFNDTGEFDGVHEQYEYIASEMNKIGIAYIHIVDHSSMGAPMVPDVMKQAIRANFKGAIILSGGYDSKRSEADLSEGKGELVAFGRPFISTPNLVEVLKNGNEPVQPDFDTFYTPGEKGFTDYPEV